MAQNGLHPHTRQVCLKGIVLALIFPRAPCEMPQIGTLLYFKKKFSNIMRVILKWAVFVVCLFLFFLKCENTVTCFILQCIA